MTIFNLGSINADHFYHVSHLPEPGETLAADEFTTGLGGKGANQSVAAARAGSKVVHIGAVGKDGKWAIERLEELGVKTNTIKIVDTPTGHAIIYVDAEGENSIVLYSGANNAQSADNIVEAIDSASPSDLLLLQNETDKQTEAAKMAKQKGVKIIYSAAPFSISKTQEMLPFISILMVNEIEFDQLCTSLKADKFSIPVPELVVTKGSNGAEWICPETQTTIHVPAFKADAVDTTAAGDTFAGYFAAGLDQGMNTKEAMEFGAAASAIKVTRHGTADAIPLKAEVMALLEK